MLGHLTDESIPELHDLPRFTFAERGAGPNVRLDLDRLRELRLVIFSLTSSEKIWRSAPRSEAS